MKKLVVIAICTLSLIGFTSCGSTSPCGLAKTEQTKQNQQQLEIIVADNATELTA
ncbi:hypothetical protein LNI90_08345 [Tenacibaculum dicentrarchi]|uniref:Uncharacterized protein n=2 Tax=Tenacibaculum TaxID=104267 RepID=A0A2I2MC12_9FLAO|nr:hypothetical protein [Tenacibaculum finnmarkense]MCD8405077.1 hypothetical protein [Tenacibaculum dicentrarchi]MBE7634607.1 hypothetical protein [Tenacibaculum finnmarkense genomovar ulcerans]MBE7646537.1 hypothetical protein [Tenacibaculum finnmarkense genomovar ulcerans]MBE7648715.1 hypothetical protein [Tenacibaculum finnmarkense genomovar ulcerans]MBE7687329.1 hypothetical protein [Tenacibaculum finnmarkense genomovar ulcerans]